MRAAPPWLVSPGHRIAASKGCRSSRRRALARRPAGRGDGIDTWRQWVWYWDAAPGLHQLQVRATDGTGATQPAKRTGIFPNGATGWDSAAVTVT